jgi:ribonuclease Z
MLTQVRAGDFRVRGVSIAGIYTSIHVPEISALFDVGIAARSTATVNTLFLSHGHVDHSGALATLLGTRALMGKTTPPRVFMPRAIAEPITASLRAMSEMQRWTLDIDPRPMDPGDMAPFGSDLVVRAFRTYHPVPSLGYELFRRVHKLKPEFADLPGHEIGRRRRTGDDLFDVVERRELAYATDTLVSVLDHEPQLLSTRVLILECTFLDDRKSLEASRSGCHIHLDELLERADTFRNEAIVLMHFSQIYKPHEVLEILDRRCPVALRERVVPFVPSSSDWPG